MHPKRQTDPALNALSALIIVALVFLMVGVAMSMCGCVAVFVVGERDASVYGHSQQAELMPIDQTIEGSATAKVAEEIVGAKAEAHLENVLSGNKAVAK